jgi:hypothetical protein
MYYTGADGRSILDGTAGLWCVNAGHGDQRIVEAVQKQVAELDYSPAFQMGHPKAFELANRVAKLMRADLDYAAIAQSVSSICGSQDQRFAKSISTRSTRWASLARISCARRLWLFNCKARCAARASFFGLVLVECFLSCFYRLVASPITDGYGVIEKEIRAFCH